MEVLVVSVLALLYLSVSPTEAQEALPFTYQAQVLSGDEQMGCPSNEQREAIRNMISQNISEILPRVLDALDLRSQDCDFQGSCQDNPATSCNAIFQQDITASSGDYWVTASNGSTVLVFCANSGQQWGSNERGWTRIAYLDMTNETYSCPHGWRYITSPNRTCGRALTAGGCQSVTYSSLGTPYSQVCGRVNGYQYAQTDAFHAYAINSSLTIDDPYVDGVVVTHGNPRNHVWTFVGGRSERNGGTAHCPCNIGNTSPRIPPWVGQDFFCESGSNNYMFSPTFYSSDLLWDGNGCDTSFTTCCSFNNPPWFCRQLSNTTNNIEVRVCGTEGHTQEDNPVELIELYVL